MNLFTLSSVSKSTLESASCSLGGKSIGLHIKPKSFRFSSRALASRKSVKKLRRDESPLKESNFLGADSSPSKNHNANDVTQNSITVTVPSRGVVLQACTLTSGLIAALGLMVRQVSHVASIEGLPIIDCTAKVSFGFEIWHLELITGLVILISSCRYLLLKTWPEFSESSEAANQQILTSLQPLDYTVVAFLPGISEELLFRGALLPLFGIDWKSVLFVAAVFGVLHLGSGRKYSFAVWATFVGFVYGYATIVSSSVIVSMASHSLNNLVGGVMWHYTSKSNSLDSKLDDYNLPT
ncbi:Abi domain-containing protein [Cephalotus follicularis]|uniref:Abi domain-containing protein n=1 Tax=Cephalotus follicularis TaxID=3775 RepID=A0A1Q3C681_CEPFO|nr:Abi domain-containing protein [Cephalotus follicularis]